MYVKHWMQNKARSKIPSVKIPCAIALVYVIGGLLGCAGVSRPGASRITAVPAELTSTPIEHRIWVLKTSWHTGLVLTAAEAGTELALLLSPMPRGRYFVFGWGDRRYYLSPHPTSGSALAALFPSRSVMLVQSCRIQLSACLGPATHLRAVWISNPGLFRLRRYLMHSLLKNQNHRAVRIARGPFPHSEFFASGLSYDAFHTCNTWTARAIETAGLPVSADGVLFADQLWVQFARSRNETDTFQVACSGLGVDPA